MKPYFYLLNDVAAEGAGGGAPAATPPVVTTAPPTGATTPPVPTPTDWTTNLNPDMKGFVQTKGFKDPSMVLDSYRNLEKLIGAPQERVLKTPEKADDPAWSEVWSKLGKPQSPELYKLDVPKEGGSEELAKAAQQMFHKADLTESQAQKLNNEWNNYQKAQTEQVLANQNAKIEADMNALKKEWGTNYEQNVKVAQQASRTFGIDQTKADALISAMGFKDAMQFMNNIGSKLGEGSFVSGARQGFSGSLSPEAAMHQIAELKADPAFIGKYVNQDAQAVSKMKSLMAQAYPGSQTLY